MSFSDAHCADSGIRECGEANYTKHLSRVARAISAICIGSQNEMCAGKGRDERENLI